MHIKIIRRILGGFALVLAAYAWLSWWQTGSRPDKIGLHRCNSLEKLAEVGKDYALIEVDVCIREDGKPDITHDTDTTFNLSLDAYFPHLRSHPGSRIWVDVKNLNEGNRQGFFRRLDSLCHRYSISHDRLIVESRQWALLPPRLPRGYHTSYYIDAPKPSGLSRSQIDSVIAQTDKVIATGHVRSISFPGWWYRHFRHAFKNRDITFLIWRHRTIEWELFLDPVGRMMLADERIGTILIKHKGTYHR